MATTTSTTFEAFLANLEQRYRDRRAHEPEYDAILYRTTFLPRPGLLRLIIQYLARHRATMEQPNVPDDDTRAELSRILQPMRWPDAAPLSELGRSLGNWDTLHVTTLMHAEIPDYPIWGPEESVGASRLGFDVRYEPDPTVDAARAGYATYMQAVKEIRDAASYGHVPECHHYLTRIVQTALYENGRDRA